MRLAQQVYGVLYIISQILAIALYASSCDVPNWMLVVLPLSKRLHSIYLLRMFNDCWAMPILLSSVFMYARGQYTVGSVLFSAALSVKMNIVLYLPALIVLLVKSSGIFVTIRHLCIILAVQIAVAMQFLQYNPKAYLANAFELSRVFLYKWSVNWRFVPEDVFLSKQFAVTLLGFHVLTLIAVRSVALVWTRWCRADAKARIGSPSAPCSTRPSGPG